MINLNHVEKDVAREVINIALSKSADSLSFFVKGKVLIGPVEFDVLEMINPVSFRKQLTEEKHYVLSTELKGELEGECFLVFSATEVEQLLKIMMPDILEKEEAFRKEVEQGFLLELDNIVSASVITQISNILKYEFYGDVPKMDILNPEQVYDFVYSKHADKYVLCFKTRFMTKNISLNPSFIWVIDEGFLAGIRKLTEEGTEVLEKYKKIDEQ